MIKDILWFFFDPSPSQALMLHNHILYMCIIVGLVTIIKGRKSKSRVLSTVKWYCLLIAFLVWARYENMPFVSMRLLLITGIISAFMHTIAVHFNEKKQARVKVLRQTKKQDPYKPKAKKHKPKKSRKHGKR